MSLTINLSPEEEQALRRIAASANLDAESYAAQLLRRMVHGEGDQTSNEAPAEAAPRGDAQERIQRMHDDIRQLGFKDVPYYSDEVMTREWIYQDHP